MNLVAYNLFLFLYSSAIRIASLFGGKPKRFLRGRQGNWEKLSSEMAAEPRKRIWVHCASLGEYEQALPVLEGIRKEWPDYALVLSFFSPSGYEVMASKAKADYVYYLPLDHPRNSRKFIEAMQPSLGIFVKYELWYHYIKVMEQKGIPLLLISAYFRPHQIFFSLWGGFFRAMLKKFHRIFVQDQPSRSLLRNLGIERVEVAGDTRFDRVLAYSKQDKGLPNELSSFLDHPRVIVAGSTWPQDEAFLQELMMILGEEWKLLIAPHDWDEKRLRRLDSRFQGNTLRFTTRPKPSVLASARVLLLDQMGYLSQVYAWGFLAWIGGGFGRKGVHNVLEAAVWGVPVAHGPYYKDYREARELLEWGGSEVATTPALLAAQLQQWAKHPQQQQERGQSALRYVASGAGASRRVLDYLHLVLDPRP